MAASPKKLKLLIVSLANSSMSGGSRASKSNFDAFAKSGCFDVTVLGPQGLSYAHAVFEQKLGTLEKCVAYISLKPAFNYRSILNAIRLIDVRKFDCLFLDTSLLGPIIPILRVMNPNLVVLSFFHNIESRSLFSNMPKFFPASYIRYISVFFAERIAVQKSHIRIVLHKTDSNKMRCTYGYGADILLPITFPAPNNGIPIKRVISTDYVLFVGGKYKPNLDAIKFLAMKIAPYVNKTIVVAGFGLECIAEKYAQIKNVSIIVAPENLAPYYRYATLVVAPIFSGGGIKTKIIEALSYGKTVICSPEARIGFEGAQDNVIVLANEPIDYINLINGNVGYDFNEDALNDFNQFFSQMTSREVALRLYDLVNAQCSRKDN